MRVDRSPTGRVAVLSLAGDLDLADAKDVRQAIEQLDDAALVVLDLRDVTFLDSSVLGVFHGASKRGPLVLVNARGGPLKAIRVTGLQHLLTGGAAQRQSL